MNYDIFTDSVSYSGALTNGTDNNSIVMDVMFENPQSGDFSVADSMTEIFRLGFHNFAMDRFGVVSPALKVIARKPEMPAVSSMYDICNGDETLTWCGLLLKNINTEGERSTTGMDSVRSIYVKDIDEDNSCCKIFRVNDVILKVGETEINVLPDFVKAMSCHRHSVPVIILRNQHEEKILLTLP